MSFNQRLWIMVDIETSGPVYGKHELLELGAAVGSRDRGIEGRFSALLKPSNPAGPSSRATYERAAQRGQPPAEVLTQLRDWVKPWLDRKATFVARPAAFDWPWIVHYAWTHLGENPFGFKAVCASSWFEARGKRFQVNLPHIAVEDAEIQLQKFIDEG